MLETTSLNGAVLVRTPAKVNLTLRVLRKRADGYHDLESVVAAVGLFDRLTFRPADDLCLDCRGADVPTGDDNLTMKAARLLSQACGVKRGARIELEKHIPAGRGFGGGSSDAAGALAGLAALWGCERTPKELACLGARLGSDVPLFFGPPVAIMRGRGDRVEPVAARPAWWLALAWPDYGNPTVDVYAAYDRTPAQGGRPAATEVLSHLEGPACEAGPWLVNDLEAAARGLRTQSPDVRALLEEAGAPAVGMTGSGSAYFAPADTEAEARRLAEAARAGGAVAAVVRMLQEGVIEEGASHESHQRQR
jgi:4-diphosphocytidyl-2-C-methyl-D-erythritol kinase